MNNENDITFDKKVDICEQKETFIDDSIETSIDVFRRKLIQDVELPFRAISTGKYREGKDFYYYREGFDAYCFTIIISGAGRVTYRGQSKRVERGDLHFASSAIPGSIKSLTDDLRFYFVNLSGAYCKKYEEIWNRKGLNIIRPRNALHYTELLDRITAKLNDPYLSSELAINSLITQLLTDAINEGLGNEEPNNVMLYPSWVQRAADILSEHCAEDIRISDLAMQLYMEQNNFIRSFRKYTGKTPKEYQIDCRMERATALLMNSDISLVEIASRCGFASHSFFSKTFKKLYGVTPSEYRRGMLN